MACLLVGIVIVVLLEERQLLSTTHDETRLLIKEAISFLANDAPKSTNCGPSVSGLRAVDIERISYSLINQNAENLIRDSRSRFGIKIDQI